MPGRPYRFLENGARILKIWLSCLVKILLMEGYCVAGTVGAKVLAGEKVIEIDRFNSVNVNLQIKHLSFSAHADAKGILRITTLTFRVN